MRGNSHKSFRHFLVLFLLLSILNATKSQDFIPDFTINPDGTGGVPPQIKHYLGVWSERGTNGVPGDAHAVHGLVTKDGAGYIVCGKGNEQGEEKRGSSIDGFVLRINPCPQQSDYGEYYLGVQLLKPGDDCRTNYKWVTRIGTLDHYDFTNWVAESPDGKYIIVTGATNVGNLGTHHIARTLTKLDSMSGEIIWSATLPINDDLGKSKSSGYESIAFTSDGGFVASGFANYPFEGGAADGPMFKSAGQIEEGSPMIEKYSSSIADANEIDENDFVVGKNIEWRYKLDEPSDNEIGSAKALRVFLDTDIEMVVGVYGTRAAIVVLNVEDGTIFKQKVLDETLGQISDVEVIIDPKNKNVLGYAIAGLSYNQIDAGTDGCTSKCIDIRGQIYILDSDLKLLKSNFWDNFEGGQYQYSGISDGFGSLINTECFSIAKAYNEFGDHDGFIVGCGNGIEGCPMFGYTDEAKDWCRHDPRKEWRSMLVRTNLEGTIVWYRQDNFWNGEENPVTSSSEYVISHGNVIVSVNDESLGLGLQTLI